MIEKICGLISAVIGLCAGLFMMILGAIGLRPYDGFWVWVAMLTIFIFSMTAVFICCLPLIGSFEKSNTELDYCPSEPDPPMSPDEMKKIGFFCPIEFVT